MKTADLPFRVENANGTHYLVEDGGDRAVPLTSCINRIASPAEVAMWAALKSRARRQSSDSTPTEAESDSDDGKTAETRQHSQRSR